MPGKSESPHDLVISGGGSISIATDRLLANARDLEGARDGAANCRRQLADLERIAGDAVLRASGVSAEASIAERELARAEAALVRLEKLSAASAEALRSAAVSYGLVEEVTSALTHRLAAGLGYAAGFFLPAIMWFMLPTAAVAFAGAALGSHIVPGGPEAVRRALADWWTRNRGALSDPVTVALLRHAVSSVDDAGAGLLRIPPIVQQLYGDEGLGILGVGTSAAVIAGVGSRCGIFAETPVRVSAVGPDTATTAPTGAAERIRRIPDPKQNGTGAQIVIEKYSSPGQADRFEVYLGGTVDFSPVASGEVWDLTSNVNAVAELPAGSYRAAQQALAAAGVTSTSDVMFTGYSQGGLIASELVASGDYSARGLLTVGAPAGQVELPPQLPVVAIEHTDDLVTAFGGHRTNNDAVVVERRAYGPGPILSERAVPAHEIGVYRQTAVWADHARSQLLADALRRFDLAPGSHDGTATSYRAERVSVK
ncbi:MAG: hypothetical protein ACOH1T_09695 [Microbacteriaceae bacterium]